MINKIYQSALFRANHWNQHRRRIQNLATPLKNANKLILADRNVGFFSTFFMIVGAIQIANMNRQKIVLHFRKSPYSRPENNGFTWWSDYLNNHPIIIDRSFSDLSDKKRVCEIIDDNTLEKITRLGHDTHPIKVNRIIRKWCISTDIETFVKTYLMNWPHDRFILGIHYRGTDKVDGNTKESTRVKYEVIINLLKNLHTKISCSFFIATDEQNFLDEVIEHFPHNTFFTPSIRSRDGLPVHLGRTQIDPYMLGRDALVDSLLLSKTNFLLKCESNLSAASICFNPKISYFNLTNLNKADSLISISQLVDSIIKVASSRSRLKLP